MRKLVESWLQAEREHYGNNQMADRRLEVSISGTAIRDRAAKVMEARRGCAGRSAAE